MNKGLLFFLPYLLLCTVFLFLFPEVEISAARPAAIGNGRLWLTSYEPLAWGLVVLPLLLFSLGAGLDYRKRRGFPLFGLTLLPAAGIALWLLLPESGAMAGSWPSGAGDREVFHSVTEGFRFDWRLLLIIFLFSLTAFFSAIRRERRYRTIN
ncbi:MAG TPA: hypothetical protein VHK69_05815 [Chitinophagaceae bacterium]|jgi:hypothetical protein|nr:hypothetical protein [Chitinophagaceae bacterium]